MKIILKQKILSFDHSVIYRLCIINILMYFFALGTNQKKIVCSLSTFMRVWRDKYSNVIIPKNNRFTECKTCSHLKAVPKGKPEVFDSDVSDKKKLNILQEIVSMSANITILSISETLAIFFLKPKTFLHDFVLQRSAKARARVTMDEHRSFVTGERKFWNK